ncbi:MAG TPA: pyruvate carboxylase subunit B [Candidatus Dormibacteraeota bacterium]|nr:pyruvate carboxylase subunit B [Candidatus Dormibacteraeota bacterium]
MSAAPARAKPRLRLTDTTFRDAHQSLIEGRLRGEDIVRLASRMDKVGFYSLEAFGGATFETEIRLNGENPWDYLRALKKAAPKTPIQALIRGQNLVANRNFADDAVQLFVSHAAQCGVDIFRIFDPLNDLRNMEAAIAAARKARRKVQGALCYAISPAHDLGLWCSLARGLQQLGCDSLVIKDTSGLLSPQTTWELVAALKEVFTKGPIGVHSHCSSGMAPMAYMAAVEAGASILDTAMSPLAWGASQPATESVVAALAGGDYDTGLDLEKLIEIKNDLQVMTADMVHDHSADRVDADILRYRIPGLMLDEVTRLLRQHGAEDRLQETLAEGSRVREELGYPPLVSPIRGLIAQQAVLNVVGGERYATVTKELKDYLQGLYGRPPVPADASVRQLVLGREEPITIRPADLLQPQVAGARAELKKHGFATSDDNVLMYMLFPSLALSFLRGELGPEDDAEEAARAGEDEPESSPDGGAEAAAAAEPAGPPPTTAEFSVDVDGEVFTVRVSGAGMSVAPAAAGGGLPAGPGAPPRPAAAGPGSVVAPMQGLIVKVPVKVGDDVKLGDVIAVLEAMKMQNDIVSTVAGKVKAVHVKEGEVVGPNQPLVNIG